MNDDSWRPRALSTFKRREVNWLWRPFIPSGFITTVAGDGEVGKTTAIYDILARITVGDPLPQIRTSRNRSRARGRWSFSAKRTTPAS